MAIDQRDEIWNAAFDTYYDAFYEEICADKLINRWQKLDETSKVLVALTASTSAVAGWALWTEPHFKPLWSGIAGIAALLTILHASLSVSGRIKDQAEIKRLFASLRIDLETFRYRMRFDPSFSIPDFTKEFSAYRDRYSSNMQLLRNDVARTKGLQERSQAQVDEILAPEIQ
ncbi:MAG TPA: hypothetical protein VEI08_03525 [Candidatus Bathyarchaeia archaeon]|nr:hypothetical protein [Candidatus Bathyarchaeia archaeon]